jgi:hypothetical protein
MGLTHPDKLVALMRRLRASTQHTLKGWALYLVLAIASGALALLANGFIGLSVVLAIVAILSGWLAGMWVVPGGEEAYARRVRRIVLNGAAHQARTGQPPRVVSTGVLADSLLSQENREALEAVAKRLDALRPPSRWKCRHDSFRGIVTGYAQALDASAAAGTGSETELASARDMALAKRRELDRATAELFHELGLMYVGKLPHGGNS